MREGDFLARHRVSVLRRSKGGVIGSAESAPGAALLEAGEGLGGRIEANQCSVIAAPEYATWLLPRPTPTATNHTNVQCCGHIGATR
jgi:hypothetical protein